MIERAFIHVAGPTGGGKTTLIERVLATPQHFDVAVIRAEPCARDQIPGESASLRDPELERYREGGALDVARYRFREAEDDLDEFYCCDFMMSASSAYLIEGHLPPGLFADLSVFVCPPVRGGVLRAAKGRKAPVKTKAPKSIEEFLGGSFDALALLFAQGTEDLSKPRRKTHSIAKEVEGIERAQVVLVNARTEEDLALAEAMKVDLDRLRKDRDLFHDVVGFGVPRWPITFAVGNLADASDKGVRRVVQRIRRACRRRPASSSDD